MVYIQCTHIMIIIHTIIIKYIVIIINHHINDIINHTKKDIEELMPIHIEKVIKKHILKIVNHISIIINVLHIINHQKPKHIRIVIIINLAKQQGTPIILSQKLENNYYKILQVDPIAEPEVILGAYLLLAKKYHPDVYKKEDASEKMQRINEAYEVLSDPMKRNKYDQSRNSY